MEKTNSLEPLFGLEIRAKSASRLPDVANVHYVVVEIEHEQNGWYLVLVQAEFSEQAILFKCKRGDMSDIIFSQIKMHQTGQRRQETNWNVFQATSVDEQLYQSVLQAIKSTSCKLPIRILNFQLLRGWWERCSTYNSQ